ncbi:tail assembly protein [Psychrobacter pygoscelis]|uniref:tail assembly protein n=1 Tax=Psychrobacter pygoscelis TaxID=2488563 RepID=UPI00103BB95D|nr:tail assembly protein [Psychrobacter pygoscelis]
MLKKIELHGVLADKFGKHFGKHFELDVATPREACEALSYQIKGFRKFMKTAHDSGLFFAVFNDDKNIGPNEISQQTGASVIRIVPKIIGSGGDTLGILQVVAGAALIGAGFFTGNPGLVAAGAGMLLGGAATLLMPTPNIEPQDPSGNKPNYGYGGAVTSVKSGNCVPLQYGRGRIGGHLLGGMSVSEDT